MPEGIPIGAAAERTVGRVAGAAGGSVIEDLCAPDQPCPPCVPY